MNNRSKLEQLIDEILPLVTGKKILDIGTGFGTVVRNLISMPGVEIISIDPEAWHFDEIELEFPDEIKNGKLKLEKKKAQVLPYEQNYFDTSLAICSLHHIPETREAISEIERVTKGRIIIADWEASFADSRLPHSHEDMAGNKDRIFEHAKKNGYRTEERGDWFLAWR